MDYRKIFYFLLCLVLVFGGGLLTGRYYRNSEIRELKATSDRLESNLATAKQINDDLAIKTDSIIGELDRIRKSNQRATEQSIDISKTVSGINKDATRAIDIIRRIREGNPRIKGTIEVTE